MSEILTKQEYKEKENRLTKPVIDFAMNTKKFKDTGCYAKEFVKVGEKEVTLMVIDDSWVGLNKEEFYNLLHRGNRNSIEEYKNKVLKCFDLLLPRMNFYDSFYLGDRDRARESFRNLLTDVLNEDYNTIEKILGFKLKM